LFIISHNTAATLEHLRSRLCDLHKGLNEYCPWTNRCAGPLALSHLVAVSGPVAVPGLLPVSVPFAVLGPTTVLGLVTVLGHITVAGLMTGPSTFQLAGSVHI